MIKNVFFIQRAAIDILLLNRATALEICVYLVISKYTDRNGFYSGVGCKAIKERLGIGQRKVDEAIKRLQMMKHSREKLLYTFENWLFKETGRFPDKNNNVGWVRGYFASEYNHLVWLRNDLVGDIGDLRPLNYFIDSRSKKKGNQSSKDNHARLLLLLYKYSNRQYSGVNYNFASIPSAECKEEAPFIISETKLAQSKLNNYFINSIFIKRYKIDPINNTSKTTSKEKKAHLFESAINGILKDLSKQGFLNISVLVLGGDENNYISAAENTDDKESMNSSLNQLDAYKQLLAEGFRIDRKLSLKHSELKGKTILSIRLERYWTKNPQPRIESDMLELEESPISPCVPNPRFSYRLDYKPKKSNMMDSVNCYAEKVESIVKRHNHTLASRNGRFHNTYWWFNPGKRAATLIGILMPAHVPITKIEATYQAKTIFGCIDAAVATEIRKKVQVGFSVD